MFFDIHAHAYRKPCPFPNRFCLPDELLAIYEKNGIEGGVLQPLVSPEVYLPQSNDDIIEMARNSGGKFVARKKSARQFSGKLRGKTQPSF